MTPTSTPRVITRSEHIISRQHISPNALRVLYRLRDAGFSAFLVGGCVRDLLIGIEPKDFDVATDALPEQVRKLFRNCRLVGRRFRLAHVFFGREIIEVATFRAATAPSPGEEPLAEADGGAGDEPVAEMDAAAGEGALSEVDAAVTEDALLQADGAEGDDSDADEADASEGDDEGADEAEVRRPERDQSEDDAGEHARYRADLEDDESEDDEALTRTDVLASGHALSEPADEVLSDRTVELSALPDLDPTANVEDDELGDDAGHPQPVVAPRAARQYQQRIAHGDESAADIDVDPNAERMFDETGRIIRDNVYGTIDADVWRRDFTCNALYYNIADFSIWDYVGGFEDVAARKLKLIGDPETRFREDPVRMLRAARFEAKLGFEIDPSTSEPIPRLKA